MVKIRLMRVGKRKQPSFRVVVADSRSPRDGRIIEAIGHYQPRQDPSVVEVDNERALYWLRNGAQPSSSVQQLLRISGAWSEFTGEPPLPSAAAPAAAPARRKATAAASVTQAEDTDEEGSEQDIEAPEVATSAEDESPANPDAGEEEPAP